MLEGVRRWSYLAGLVLSGLGLGVFPVMVEAVQPFSLPEARVGIPYAATLLAERGQDEPYYW